MPVSKDNPIVVEHEQKQNTAWLPYVAPIALFIALSMLEERARDAYVWLYIAKILIVSIALIVFRSAWRDIRLDTRVILPAALVGLAVLAEWILLDKWIPVPRLSARVAFNPYQSISDDATRILFLVVRLYGLVILVPVMEELFWRSFLLRFLTQHDWVALPVGAFSRNAFWIVAVGFALTHPEWLVAFICAIAYGLLLWKTRSLFACVVAHAVTNLGLGIYVLMTEDWVYW